MAASWVGLRDSIFVCNLRLSIFILKIVELKTYMMQRCVSGKMKGVCILVLMAKNVQCKVHLAGASLPTRATDRAVSFSKCMPSCHHSCRCCAYRYLCNEIHCNIALHLITLYSSINLNSLPMNSNGDHFLHDPWQNSSLMCCPGISF